MNKFFLGFLAGASSFVLVYELVEAYKDFRKDDKED